MRKLLCSLILGAVAAVGVNLAAAQSADSAPPPPRGEWGHGPHGPMDPAAQAAHMAKHLGLTSEQRTQVENILTNEQAQMKALDTNQTITHQQWLTQTRALHEQAHTQIKGLLTDAQKAQLQEHRGGPLADHEGAPPPPEQ
jgi:Spy/CpxP family protein refolding chaperone